MTEEQKQWMLDNPTFEFIGRPRAVKFEEWGNLYPDGTYERMDNQRMGVIRLPCIGVGVVNHQST